jgi:hypothetical protein
LGKEREERSREDRGKRKEDGVRSKKEGDMRGEEGK